jgi:hypothetical protein
MQKVDSTVFAFPKSARPPKKIFLTVRGESLIRIRARFQACRKCHVMNAPLGAGSWRQSFTTGR